MIRYDKKRNMFGWRREGLRTRYRPRPGMIGWLVFTAPWVNVLLLLGAFVFLSSRLVLQPGVVVELPRTHMPSGTGRGLTAVVLSHRHGLGGGARAEMVFFDDEAFAVSDDVQMRDLSGRFGRMAKDRADSPLIIEADVNVRYGTIVRLCDMARKAGLQVANLAERLQTEPGGE